MQPVHGFPRAFPMREACPTGSAWLHHSQRCSRCLRREIEKTSLPFQEVRSLQSLSARSCRSISFPGLVVVGSTSWTVQCRPPRVTNHSLMELKLGVDTVCVSRPWTKFLTHRRYDTPPLLQVAHFFYDKEVCCEPQRLCASCVCLGFLCRRTSVENYENRCSAYCEVRELTVIVVRLGERDSESLGSLVASH